MPALILMFIIKGLSDMRQSITYAMAIAAICLTTACQNKLQPEAPEQVARTFSVYASQDGTRTAFYGEVGTTASYTWEQGDRLRLFELSDGDRVLAAVSNPLPEPDRNVTFSVTFNEDPQGNDLRYVGVYLPGVNEEFGNYHSWATRDWFDEWGTAPSVFPWVICSDMPYQQTPTAASFDPRADLLVSKMVRDDDMPRPGEIDLAFARVGSVAKITLMNLPPGEEVASVNLNHGASWTSTGRVYYEPESEKIAYEPAIRPKSVEDNYIYYIEAAPKNLFVDPDGNAVIWLRVLSGKLTDYFSIDVITVNGKIDSRFEKYVDLSSMGRTIQFDEGDITAFSVSMEQPPVILPFTFSQETLTLFPELDSDHPQIRIPRDYYMYKDEDLKVSFASVPNNSCYVSLAMDEEWLGLYWNNDEEGNYYLHKESSYFGTTDTHRATLYIYWDNAEYKIPIIEDEDYYANLGLPLPLDLMIGEQVVTNQNVTVVSGTEVTFKASFGTFPSWLGDYSIMSRWVAANQSQTDNGYVPSPYLPIINPESYYNSSEIAITPGQPGSDMLGFEYYVIPSNPSEWLEYIHNYAICYVTVSNGDSTSSNLYDRFTGQGGSAGGGNPDDPYGFDGGTVDL